MRKNYILDTSVLIDNPDCVEIFRNGGENGIIKPRSTMPSGQEDLRRRPRLTADECDRQIQRCGG